jgi:hypothetical protein
MKRFDKFEYYWDTFKSDNKNHFIGKVYGETIEFWEITSSTLIEYYGIKIELNWEDHRVYLISVSSRADISYKHKSLQDYLQFINRIQGYDIIGVINGVLCGENKIPIKKDIMKKYIKLSDDKKSAYQMINSLIPKSNYYNESYFDLIGKSSEQIIKYIKKDKLLSKRYLKRQLGVLE